MTDIPVRRPGWHLGIRETLQSVCPMQALAQVSCILEAEKDFCMTADSFLIYHVCSIHDQARNLASRQGMSLVAADGHRRRRRTQWSAMTSTVSADSHRN